VGERASPMRNTREAA